MNDTQKYEQMINYMLGVIYQQTTAIQAEPPQQGAERAKTVRFLALAVAALLQYRDYGYDRNEPAPEPDAEQQETADNGSEEEE